MITLVLLGFWAFLGFLSAGIANVVWFLMADYLAHVGYQQKLFLSGSDVFRTVRLYGQLRKENAWPKWPVPCFWITSLLGFSAAIPLMIYINTR